MTKISKLAPLKKLPKQGGIWLLKNPERIKEIGKYYRPVLIISRDEHNEYSKSAVGLPLTTITLKKVPMKFYKIRLMI